MLFVLVFNLFIIGLVTTISKSNIVHAKIKDSKVTCYDTKKPQPAGYHYTESAGCTKNHSNERWLGCGGKCHRPPRADTEII